MPTTIALVDDDQNILASLSAALVDEGYSVETYADGAERLRVWANGLPIWPSWTSKCRAWTAWNC